MPSCYQISFSCLLKTGTVVVITLERGNINVVAFPPTFLKWLTHRCSVSPAGAASAHSVILNECGLVQELLFRFYFLRIAFINQTANTNRAALIVC